MPSANKHFRRCHVCDKISESKIEISRCRFCEKPMAKFYYFDASKITVYTDDQLRPMDTEFEYSPIRGLTVVW